MIQEPELIIQPHFLGAIDLLGKMRIIWQKDRLQIFSVCLKSSEAKQINQQQLFIDIDTQTCMLKHSTML